MRLKLYALHESKHKLVGCGTFCLPNWGAQARNFCMRTLNCHPRGLAQPAQTVGLVGTCAPGGHGLQLTLAAGVGGESDLDRTAGQHRVEIANASIARRSRRSLGGGIAAFCLLIGGLMVSGVHGQPGEAVRVRSMAFRSQTRAEALAWQEKSRSVLYKLMMGGGQPERSPLDPQLLQRIEIVSGGYALEELTLRTLSDRRAHVWVARPMNPQSRVPAVLALHGHGGTGEEIVRGKGLYWYGRTLAAMGYVVIAPDIGQHTIQHTNWSLMGERVWDALRCVDYLVTLPEVDTNRMGVCGLSLGGETTMYVAALDERLRTACSSGWLTTVDNMKQGHCPCWNFEGLEAHFDFADIFACVAPRALVCELGGQERAPGGFPVDIGQRAFAEIRNAYRVFGAENKAVFTVHPGGHVFDGRDFWPVLHDELGVAYPWTGTLGAFGPAAEDVQTGRANDSGWEAELLRRGEIARRCFCAALGVFNGWWRTVDACTGLFPRTLSQPVWAPNDNAADMLPFLAITAWYLAPERLEEVLNVIRIERQLTTRWNGLPDWYALTNRAWLYPQLDTNRLIFCAAEYCKDGLLPMTEVMGRGLWTDRMIELVDAIFANAPYKTEFGLLPANDTEVNGELLQVLSRLYCMTRDHKYLEWARRIGDAYCFEVLPGGNFIPSARWDFENHRAITDRFSLNDHGNEIVGGLSELFIAALAGAPNEAARYCQPLEKLKNRLLSSARNSDGLWVQVVCPSTGEVLDQATPDTWGYALSGVAAFGNAIGDASAPLAVREALRGLKQGRYLHWDGADSYADSIEGALVLLDRFSEEAGWAWLEKVVPIFLGKQREDGVVEGWYGDGNYARTALMVGLYYTQGVRCQPWHPKLCLGARRTESGVRIVLQSAEEWSGRLLFDLPRHRLNLNLPMNYPRLNEFPEWFAVDRQAVYEVRIGSKSPESRTGAQLEAGVFVTLRPGETVILELSKK